MPLVLVRYLSLVVAIAFLWSPARAQGPVESFPQFVDATRSRGKQLEAADEAADELRSNRGVPAVAVRLLGDPSGVVRDRALETIRREWSEAHLLSLTAGLADRSSLVREGVAEIFGHRGFQRSVDPLRACLAREKEESTRLVMLWALAELAPSESEGLFRKIFEKEKRSYRVRAQALRSWSRGGGEKFEAARARALEDPHPGVRLAALDCWSATDPRAALEAAIPWIADPPRPPKDYGPNRLLFGVLALARAHAAEPELREVLARLIDALIGRLESAAGRELAEIGSALRRIGGVDLADDALAWREWWKANRDEWKPGGAGSSSSRGNTGVVRYHGLPVSSRHAIFLLDLSGGMGRTLEGEWEGEGPTRLDYSKKELDRVLRELDADSDVNVVYFASYLTTYAQGPVSLRKHRDRLRRFNQEQRIPRAPGKGRGNLYDALAFALTRPGVDTIYLLTEGAPTEGKYQDYDRFLFHYEPLARDTRVQVHCLLLGETGSRNREFLRKIAERTGGAYQEVKPRLDH